MKSILGLMNMGKKFWDDKFNILAVYNAEVSRGILHTQEYYEKMHLLQEEYDTKLREHCKREGIVVIGA